MIKLRDPNEDLFAESRMSFGAHLEELRKVLVRSLIWVSIGCVIGFWGAEKIVEVLQLPLNKAVVQFKKTQAQVGLENDIGYIPPEYLPLLKDGFVPDQVSVDPGQLVAALQSAADLRQLLGAKAGKMAIGIGPGLGQDQWAQQLLLLVLDAEQSLVVDADALNLLAMLPRRQDNWILTPHPAEAARLLGCKTADIEQDRVAAVRLIQEKFGGICVLKGAGTLVSNGAEVAFCAAGNPGMSSGGMGDVLSGIITALLAQGLPLFEAAYIGVQVHAMAADEAACLGERGMIASDVLAQLRGVVNQTANQIMVRP